MDDSTYPDSAVRDKRQSVVAALDNRWLIMAALMLGVGVLGLPVLWKSRAFSTSGKIGWTVVIAALNVAWWAGLVGLIYVAIRAAAEPVFAG